MNKFKLVPVIQIYHIFYGIDLRNDSRMIDVFKQNRILTGNTKNRSGLNFYVVIKSKYDMFKLHLDTPINALEFESKPSIVYNEIQML